MRLRDEPLPGVKVVELQPFGDTRGSFVETFNRQKLTALGVDHEFVQDNESWSHPVGTVRGVHFQLPPNAQGKLVRVTKGRILDVAVDLRSDSPTYRSHCSVELAGNDNLVFWIPAGFGHGFCTLEPDTVVSYKVTSLYAPESDRSVRWDDPGLAIDWPVDPADAVLSDKDAAAPSVAEVEEELSCASW